MQSTVEIERVIAGVLDRRLIAEFPERIERFVREPERERITGLSKAGWWRLETLGRAPKRIRIESRTVAWRLSDLQQWVELTATGQGWSGATRRAEARE